MILIAQNSYGCYLEELEKKKLLKRKSKELENNRKGAAREIKEIKACFNCNRNLYLWNLRVRQSKYEYHNYKRRPVNMQPTKK